MKKMISAVGLLLLIFPVLAYGFQGRVVGVQDGDTIEVLHDGKGQRVRLYGVDAPEKHQDYGEKAKQFLSERVYGKTVEVEPVDRDQYQRTVGIVSLDGKVVNRELVEQGYAWVYDQYCKRSECAEWDRLEEKAKGQKLGLWALPATPPWEFRHSGNGTGSASVSKPRGADQKTGTVFHGNVRSNVFHRPGCQHYDCKNCTAEFPSREDAIKAGYRPCKICDP